MPAVRWWRRRPFLQRRLADASDGVCAGLHDLTSMMNVGSKFAFSRPYPWGVRDHPGGVDEVIRAVVDVPVNPKIGTLSGPCRRHLAGLMERRVQFAQRRARECGTEDVVCEARGDRTDVGAWWLTATVIPSYADAKVSAKKDREAACNSAASCGRKRAHGSRFQPIRRWSFIPKRAACIAAGALLSPNRR